MTPGPPPPEYGPGKPPRSRDEFGLGRPRSSVETLQSSVDSLQASIEKVIDEFEGRKERSEVRRTDSTILRQRIEEVLKLEKDRKTAAERRARILKWLGGVASAVTVVVLGVWRGYEMSQPEPPSIEHVQNTVEQRTSALEDGLRTNVERVSALESKLDDVLSAIGALGEKIDAAQPPPAEPDPGRPARPRRPR